MMTRLRAGRARRVQSAGGARSVRPALALGAALLLAGGGGGADDGGAGGGLFGSDGYEQGGPSYYGMGMPYYGGGVGWGGFNYDE